MPKRFIRSAFIPLYVAVVVKADVKGTLILRERGRFFKVTTVRSIGDNRYIFECRDLESKQHAAFERQMLGFLEAMDSTQSVMKDPKDMMIVDLDNQGKWRIVSKDKVNKIMNR